MFARKNLKENVAALRFFGKNGEIKFLQVVWSIKYSPMFSQVGEATKWGGKNQGDKKLTSN